MLLAALVANIGGMGWLALAMDAHWRQACGDVARPPATTTLLRALGAASIAVSLVLCVSVDHPTMAALVWIMALAAAALTIAFTLSWRARWLRVLVLRAPTKA
jgi:hypothetical protein